MADVFEVTLDTMKSFQSRYEKIDREQSRYPFCIVWTPIPGLSWFLPFIGHMGICTSSGVIRDFAGPYFVSHNLCCDNCHSHVAMALNLMRYNNITSWNMVKLCVLCFIYSRHVSFVGFLKTWLPFLMICGIIVTVTLAFRVDHSV